MATAARGKMLPALMCTRLYLHRITSVVISELASCHKEFQNPVMKASRCKQLDATCFRKYRDACSAALLNRMKHYRTSHPSVLLLPSPLHPAPPPLPPRSHPPAPVVLFRPLPQPLAAGAVYMDTLISRGLWHRHYSLNLPGWCWAQILQSALVGLSSSLHTEVCNAVRFSDGVIHSRIS